MYLTVDIGATKTLLACFDARGALVKKLKFPTDHNYERFLEDLAKNVEKLGKHNYLVACIAIPGKVDREHGIGIAFGNLPWLNVSFRADTQKFLHCPIILENDANLAGLSEAKLIKNEFNHVLYVTISTGIGTGVITDGIINPEFADSEGGHLMLEHNGIVQAWQAFASGTAIVKRYGKQASDIKDVTIWHQIAHDLSLGFIDLIVTIEPEIIIVGGGVGHHFELFGKFLAEELQKYAIPLLHIPEIREAKRAEEAVVYGCYELAKDTYGNTAR
jgi:predicted NBD/HSP70 family sugar kinase